MIYYFSATGNSQHVTTRIAEALGTQAQSIETADTQIRLARAFAWCINKLTVHNE